jgi:hypothetical protein
MESSNVYIAKGGDVEGTAKVGRKKGNRFRDHRNQLKGKWESWHWDSIGHLN